MASNFAFSPMGLSQAVTVGGAAPVTVSLSLVAVGATGTTALTAGNYLPSAVRVALEGTASMFIQFGSSAGTISVSVTNGMRMLPNSVEVFRNGGLPFMAFACAGTTTVTAGLTLGEGM